MRGNEFGKYVVGATSKPRSGGAIKQIWETPQIGLRHSSHVFVSLTFLLFDLFYNFSFFLFTQLRILLLLALNTVMGLEIVNLPMANTAPKSHVSLCLHYYRTVCAFIGRHVYLFAKVATDGPWGKPVIRETLYF